MAFELSPQEEQFAEALVRLRNPTRAYHASLGHLELLDYRTCQMRGAAMERRPNVRRRVRELREELAQKKYEAEKLTIPAVLKKFLMLAEADPNELIALRVGSCRYCHGDGHQYQYTQREYLEKLETWENLDPELKALQPVPSPKGGLGYDRTREPDPECPECCGEGIPRVVLGDTMQLSEAGALLFQGVKETKDGVEIKMADRMKALDSVARILGAYKDTVDVNAKVRGAVAAVHQAVTNPEDAQRAYLAMVAQDG